VDARLLQRAYDRAADDYDARFREQQAAKHRALAEVVPAPGAASVLDAGGGTGLLREQLVAHASGWGAARFVVADLSTGMLLRARARGQDVVQADVRRLPFRTGAFARVFCVTGLVDAADVERATTSLVRVTAPGGLLALSLRADDWPEDLARVVERLPISLENKGETAGDVWRVWRRR
jgi:ubiquinone/menaquinone biosynthesis C-methylase UbiE